MGLFDIFRRKKRTAKPDPNAERGDWKDWFLNREGFGGLKFSPDEPAGGYVDVSPWVSFDEGGYVQSGPKRRQKLQPRSQQAQINRFNTQVRQDPNFTRDHWYQSHSPAGNQYDRRDFNTIDQNMTTGIRYKGGSHRDEELKAMLFSNAYHTNPDTNQKFGHSMSNFQGPNREWGESRYIFPDASGIGQRWDSEGNESEYPIQLKGPQTWNYDPGNSGIMGLEMADATDYMNKMKEGYKRIDPYLPDVDWQDKSIGHEWNTPLWGGNLGIGGEYDIDDDEYNVGINWGTAFG